MATWPSYAKIKFAGFSQSRKPAVTRSEMDIGPAKQIRTASRVMVTRPCQVWLDSLTDYNSFITWFRTSISHGADWFDWIDPVTGTTKSARIVGGQLDEETPQALGLAAWVIALKLETWDDA